MSTSYTREADGVWQRAGFSGIAYTDGSDVEQRLLDAVSGARRIDTFSPELVKAIADWPSEYHLSRSRHCLLRPLGIKAGDRVLELGCGGGAITRYLGEIGADVVAVEGSRARARIAAARCRDLANVQVKCDDLFALDAEGHFDWVLLIGVLEYAPVFSTEPNPVGVCLKAAVRQLGSGGRLVVAIENKLGLKYFNGCAEDHVGKAFFGIEGLYRAGTPVTFGRRELGEILRSAGLSAQQWLYPFPDYKLPAMILSTPALASPDLNIADLLLHTQSRDYGGRPYRLFNETLVMASLASNALVGDLSNSFLVVARHEPVEVISAESLAWSFAVHRHEYFATETTIRHRESELVVLKTPIGPPRNGSANCEAAPRIVCHRKEAAYVAGTLLARRIVEASAREMSDEDMAAEFLLWFDELLRRAIPVIAPGGPVAGGGGRRNLRDFAIDGRLVDCVPFNMIETAEGLRIIDEEWQIAGCIPLGQVVCRGLIYSLRLCLTRTQRYRFASILAELCAKRDLAIDKADIDVWLDAEADFQADVTGRVSDRPNRQDVPAFLLSPLFEIDALKERVHRQQTDLEETVRQCQAAFDERDRMTRERDAALCDRDAAETRLKANHEELSAQIGIIHDSMSWRLTRPVRFTGRTLRQVKIFVGGWRSRLA